LYPGKLDFDKCKGLIGNHAVIEGLKGQADALSLWLMMEDQAGKFLERRKAFLLY
jgi:hypothetical protein